MKKIKVPIMKNLSTPLRDTITALLLGTAVSVFTSNTIASERALSLGLDSRYISEGRDNTGEKALRHMGFAQTLGDFNGGLWYGQSSFEDYYEFNLSVGHSAKLGDFTLASGYTYLHFSANAPDDHELSLDLTSDDAWLIDLSISAYYSYRSKGTYLLADIAYSLALSEAISIAPYLSLGGNYGYVSDEHRGVDHYGAGLRGEFLLTEGLSLFTYIASIEPIDKAEDESLVSATWLGASLAYVF